MVAGCEQFNLVQSGDGCYALASKYAIALSNFYSWSRAVKTNCTLLLDDYYRLRRSWPSKWQKSEGQVVMLALLRIGRKFFRYGMYQRSDNKQAHDKWKPGHPPASRAPSHNYILGVLPGPQT